MDGSLLREKIKNLKKELSFKNKEIKKLAEINFSMGTHYLTF
jgi:hypothetical protein